MAGWVSPTGHSDPNGYWTAEEYAYDDNENTFAYSSGDAGFYLELSHSAINCNKVQFYPFCGPGGLAVDVFYSDDWHNIHSGSVTDSQWNEANIGSTQSVTKARVKTLTYGGQLNEFDFNEVEAAARRIFITHQ